MENRQIPPVSIVCRESKDRSVGVIDRRMLGGIGSERQQIQLKRSAKRISVSSGKKEIPTKMFPQVDVGPRCAPTVTCIHSGDEGAPRFRDGVVIWEGHHPSTQFQSRSVHGPQRDSPFKPTRQQEQRGCHSQAPADQTSTMADRCAKRLPCSRSEAQASGITSIGTKITGAEGH